MLQHDRREYGQLIGNDGDIIESSASAHFQHRHFDISFVEVLQRDRQKNPLRTEILLRVQARDNGVNMWLQLCQYAQEILIWNHASIHTNPLVPV